MKRNRIKMPYLPSWIIKQQDSTYRCSKTGRKYTLKALRDIYSNKTGNVSTEQRSALISPEMKHEQITNKRWDLNY